MRRVFQPPDPSLLITKQIGLSGRAGKTGEQTLMLMNTEIEDPAGSCTCPYISFSCLTCTLAPIRGRSCSQVDFNKVTSAPAPDLCSPQQNHNIHQVLEQAHCQRAANKVVNPKFKSQHIAQVWLVSVLTDVDKPKKRKPVKIMTVIISWQPLSHVYHLVYFCILHVCR